MICNFYWFVLSIWVNICACGPILVPWMGPMNVPEQSRRTKDVDLLCVQKPHHQISYLSCMSGKEFLQSMIANKPSVTQATTVVEGIKYSKIPNPPKSPTNGFRDHIWQKRPIRDMECVRMNIWRFQKINVDILNCHCLNMHRWILPMFVDLRVPPSTPWSMILPQALLFLNKTHPGLLEHASCGFCQFS